jgi:hypothetical protein
MSPGLDLATGAVSGWRGPTAISDEPNGLTDEI